MALDTAKIYSDLANIKVQINFDDNPLPHYIQERVFECNEASRKVEKHYLAVKQELSRVRQQYKIEKFSFESRKRHALTNNEKIKKLPTGKERELAVEELFEDDLRKIMTLENELDSLKDVMDAVVMVQSNLKNTSSDIRVQLKVMENQINRLNIGNREDPEVAELTKSLAEIDKEEAEISLDDVESASESIQEEPADEPITAEVAGEDTSSDGGQGVSEKSEGDDVLSSFLVEDDSDIGEQDSEETPQEGEVETSEDSDLVEDADAVSTPKDTGAPAKGESKTKKSAPVMDLDLSDIGIDIDTSTDTEVTETESTPNTNNTDQKTTTNTEQKSAQKTESGEKKKERSDSEKRKDAPSESAVVPPVKKSESTKSTITDVDLDDILTMLDK